MSILTCHLSRWGSRSGRRRTVEEARKGAAESAGRAESTGTADSLLELVHDENLGSVDLVRSQRT